MTIAGSFAPALNCDTCYGTLTIDGIDMQNYAWCLTDLSVLWSGPGKKGVDLPVPDDDADVPYDVRPRSSEVALPFSIVGSVTPWGSDVANPYEGLAAWRTYLAANVEASPGGDGTRAAVFSPPGLSPYTAGVHVLRFTGQLRPGATWVGFLELRLPDPALYMGL